MKDSLFDFLARLTIDVDWQRVFGAVLLVLLGWPLIFFITRLIRATVGRRFTSQHGLIASKIFFNVSFGILILMVIGLLGLPLTPLLGTAGVIGVAVGFASQTSFSNIISGFFLVFERPFVVDDVIEVNGITGQVISIDMISVKLRTADNKLVRIPNETMVKSAVTNTTYYPVVRSDITLGIAHAENFGRVREVLLDLARRNPYCLVEPGPVVAFSGYGPSSVDLQFMVWSTRADGLLLKNTIQEEIKRRFDAEGIEIPLPHVTVVNTAPAPAPAQTAAPAPQPPAA